MNFKIFFTIVGIILSLASAVYSQPACIQVIVCGTDGKTYSTPCALAEAAKCKPGLKVASYGECGAQA